LLLVIDDSNLSIISHRSATVHPLQTDRRQTDDNHRKWPALKFTA